MNDVMVDIETLGNRPTSVITQIGACYFDRNTGKVGKKFAVNIRIQDCLDKGLTIDGETIRWWFEQQVPKTFLYNPIDLCKALALFRDFINKKCFVWSHATFDIPIIANAYHAIGEGLPFSFRNTRDIRTLVDLADLQHRKIEGDHYKNHNALDDCIYQVGYCKGCFKALNDK